MDERKQGDAGQTPSKDASPRPKSFSNLLYLVIIVLLIGFILYNLWRLSEILSM